METTFMTIHNLTPDANILFASESIVDILEFQPHEVLGRSCFEYFHPDEVPFAKNVHDRGVKLDKAASLHYARIMNKRGDWIGCECVFTIVHDVLVACTSIYKGDDKSQRRAADAPTVRRLFSSSPRDPRYHMLEHLSSKFTSAPQPHVREPRAALILNRFTRTLTVMFATNAVAGILGVSAEQLTSKSFYECIQENCLPDAIRCLESAKANDSIAYLRFWYRDPRRPAELEQLEREASHSSDDDDGGVTLDDHMELDSPGADLSSGKESRLSLMEEDSHTSSGGSSDHDHNASNDIFDNDPAYRARSSGSSLPNSGNGSNGRRSAGRRVTSPAEPIEIEAVVSCTSDGLVVILRRARPLAPTAQQPHSVPLYANGMFAAPWGVDPVHPHVPDIQLAFQPQHLRQVQAVAAHSRATGGPALDSFMNSIREVAVFAWSLTGINGSIAKYGRGTPRGESVPPSGFPVWDPQAQQQLVAAPTNQAHQKWTELNQRAHHPRTNEGFGESRPPYLHQRQEQLIRQQYGYGSGPMGSDVPGSPARHYLGKYIGDDGRGPGYFPRYTQLPQTPTQHTPNNSFSPNQYCNSAEDSHPSASKAQEAAPQQGQSPQSNNFHSNRYLWY